jgi:hypothetical protein
MAQPGPHTGNPGLASAEQMVTAAPGFRPLKVAGMDRESSSVVSLVLEPADGRPLTVPLPGQFVVLRLRPQVDAPPVLRSYSLSDLPGAGRYRITIKQEPHGIASTYVSTQLRTGDMLDVSEPRGAFILRGGDLPVVLLSAGVGVTPVMAMLHALAVSLTFSRLAGATVVSIFAGLGRAEWHIGEHPRRRHDPLAVDRERDLAFEASSTSPLEPPWPRPASADRMLLSFLKL